MAIRFIHAGLCFFAGSLVVALFVMALAPIPFIRALGTIAFACAAVGLAWHLYAMREDDPRAFSALGHRLQSMRVRVQSA